MSYTVEKRYVVDVDRDGKPVYKKEVLTDLEMGAIGIIDLYYDRGLDRVRIKKLDDFGQVIREKNYYIGEVYPRNAISKNSKVYDILTKYYKRDPLNDIVEPGDTVILTSKGTFNIISNDEVVREGVKIIDIKEIGENRKYQKDGITNI